jgi:hypothetical protein
MQGLKSNCMTLKSKQTVLILSPVDILVEVQSLVKNFKSRVTPHIGDEMLTYTIEYNRCTRTCIKIFKTTSGTPQK